MYGLVGQGWDHVSLKPEEADHAAILEHHVSMTISAAEDAVFWLRNVLAKAGSLGNVGCLAVPRMPCHGEPDVGWLCSHSALGVGPGLGCNDMIAPETYRFSDDGRFPNSILPLLVYRHALPSDPAAMERAFGAHDWSNSWRDGIFDYHHFHSIAHEVLGIAAGVVQVAFGGPSGAELMLRAGDVVVIPAGVAHRNMGHGADLLVVGAYPNGSDYDIRRGDPAEHEAALRAIAAVALPSMDPAAGRQGHLRRLWVEDGKR